MKEPHRDRKYLIKFPLDFNQRSVCNKYHGPTTHVATDSKEFADFIRAMSKEGISVNP